jgi:uncharacterized GH25 family protein
MTRRIALGAAVAMIFGGAQLAAHDLWIEPTAFAPEVGRLIGIRLRVGQDLLGDPVPRDPALIDEFIAVTTTGRTPVVGRDGSDPAGIVRISSPGLAIVGYRSNRTAIAIDAQKFNQYLKEEGLEAIAAIRERRGQSGLPAREVFSRCAKTLLSSGSAQAAEGDRALGFTLELQAERNPYVAASGDELAFRLTYLNQPLAGALVIAINRLNPAAKLSARTDHQGRVRFTLPDGGMWLVKAVHMIPAPPGTDAEWESFWASLTFELKDRAVRPLSR